MTEQFDRAINDFVVSLGWGAGTIHEHHGFSYVAREWVSNGSTVRVRMEVVGQPEQPNLWVELKIPNAKWGR